MKLLIEHQLGIEEGRARLRSGIARLAAEHGGKVQAFSEQWSGDRLEFTVQAYGCRARGAASVEESRVLVDVDLPLGLRAFAGAARDYLVREGRAFFRPRVAVT